MKNTAKIVAMIAHVQVAGEPTLIRKPLIIFNSVEV